MTPGLRTKPLESAARLRLAIKEVERRRPSMDLLNRRSRPYKEEVQSCCRSIRWDNRSSGIRHLCTVKHIAAKFGVGYQELLDAVWEEEADTYTKEGGHA